MKPLITMFTGIIISSFLLSQNYFPLVQDNNEWSVLEVIQAGPYPWDTTYWTEIYKISGDTILDNQSYKKVYRYVEEFSINWNFCGGMREENHKVWRKGTSSDPEKLIYDFTLSIGDTVSWLFDTMIVDSILYKPINEEDRKHIYFSYQLDPEIKELWIEGIGSNRGILNSGSGGFEGGVSWLLCMKENQVLIYQNTNYNNCYLAVNVKENSTSSIHVFPNPAIDRLNIGNRDNVEIESISIIDINGKILKEFEENKNEIDLYGISSGVYFLKVTCQNGVMDKKIIIE